MDQTKPKPSKRLDLQGIRALAIIVVLGFHFFPEYCPNGYLGVDQFFVLSGFLMCMLLKRAENQSSCSLITIFYSKRFKRILPLYLLIIFISMICLYNFFPDTAIETNQESANHALLFVSNRPKTDQEDYFQMLSIAIDIFTHTWSLSVEIQFYFLVPFIFLIATRIPEKFQYLYYGLIGSLSFIFFYISPSTVAFNSVFARIWQFLIGMIVYLLGSTANFNHKYQVLETKDEDFVKLLENGEKGFENDDEGDNEEDTEEDSSQRKQYIEYLTKCSAHVVLMFLVLITTFPWTLSAPIIRPLVTVGTGLLMLISEDNLVLANRILVYIGDISYSLYLIHWPIYAYWKLTCDGNRFLLICALLSSITLANITFETFEKWYLKLSSTSVGLLVVLLFFSNVIAIHKNELMDNINSFGRNISSIDEVTDSMTNEDAVKMNYRWNVNDLKNLYAPTCDYESIKTPYGWCRHKALPQFGRYKMAIFGNSWTANHAKLFVQECGYKAKSLLQGAAWGCEPLLVSANTDTCRANFTTFVERIKKEKPDYAFHITREVSIGQGFPKNVTTFDKDPTYQTMKSQMLKLIENIKYKLYIVHAIPSVIPGSISKIAEWVKNGTDPMVVQRQLLRPHGFEMARKRYEQLVKDCQGKCILIDYTPIFYNNSTKIYEYYDKKGFSYWTADQHFSPHGIEHIRHVWTGVCEKL